jgi:hypothetical protein
LRESLVRLEARLAAIEARLSALDHE